MVNVILQDAIESFEKDKFDKVMSRYNHLEKERLKFITKFPMDSIMDMDIDDYVVGKENKQSFCYYLETRLRDLGSIKGGSPADKKFGVYYNKNLKKYVNIKRFGENTNKAFSNIKSEINNLIKIGRGEIMTPISYNKLSPMFRGKILSTYFPEKYINIYSDEHIDFFLSKLNIKYDPSEFIEVKKQKLLNFKEKNFSENWNNYIFSYFLYYWADPKLIENTITETEIEHYFNATDENAGYKESVKLTRERKLNHKILYMLKEKYNGTCQICGERIGEDFGEPIVEAHHIEYYSISQNNDMSNILIVCPNHHSIIHKYNPIFDRENLCYRFKDGKILKIKVNKHL